MVTPFQLQEGWLRTWKHGFCILEVVLLILKICRMDIKISLCIWYSEHVVLLFLFAESTWKSIDIARVQLHRNFMQSDGAQSVPRPKRKKQHVETKDTSHMAKESCLKVETPTSVLPSGFDVNLATETFPPCSWPTKLSKIKWYKPWNWGVVYCVIDSW